MTPPVVSIPRERGTVSRRRSLNQDKFDDTRNTSGTANQGGFVDIQLVNLGVAEDLLNRFKSTADEILVGALDSRHVWKL